MYAACMWAAQPRGASARRRHLNIRGKSANLPAITERDWLDIKFGVDVGVDYYALSFVRNADVIYELKHWLSQQGAPHRLHDCIRMAMVSCSGDIPVFLQCAGAQIGVLAKIESADSVGHLDEILDAVDGAMVARGDLGAELPVEQARSRISCHVVQGPGVRCTAQWWRADAWTPSFLCQCEHRRVGPRVCCLSCQRRCASSQGSLFPCVQACQLTCERHL